MAAFISTRTPPLLPYHSRLTLLPLVVAFANRQPRKAPELLRARAQRFRHLLWLRLWCIFWRLGARTCNADVVLTMGALRDRDHVLAARVFPARSATTVLARAPYEGQGLLGKELRPASRAIDDDHLSCLLVFAFPVTHCRARAIAVAEPAAAAAPTAVGWR